MSAEVRRLAEDAARALGVGEIEVILGGEDQALTRFANNTIHQNMADWSSEVPNWHNVNIAECFRDYARPLIGTIPHFDRIIAPPVAIER